MTSTEPITVRPRSDAFLDAMRAERQEREARQRQDRATLAAAITAELGRPLEECTFAEVQALAREMDLATPAEKIICPACQGEPAEDSMGSDYVRRGDRARHACLLPQPMHVMSRDSDTGQRAPQEVFYLPYVNDLIEDDPYFTDALALALYGRLTIECTRAQQEDLRELHENGEAAREEREAEIAWAKDPGLGCDCRGVVAASREDGTPDLSSLNITHASGCPTMAAASAPSAR